MNDTTNTNPSGNALQLALATGACAVDVAVFGSVSAMMPLLKENPRALLISS